MSFLDQLALSGVLFLLSSSTVSSFCNISVIALVSMCLLNVLALDTCMFMISGRWLIRGHKDCAPVMALGASEALCRGVMPSPMPAGC